MYPTSKSKHTDIKETCKTLRERLLAQCKSKSEKSFILKEFSLRCSHDELKTLEKRLKDHINQNMPCQDANGSHYMHAVELMSMVCRLNYDTEKTYVARDNNTTEENSLHQMKRADCRSADVRSCEESPNCIVRKEKCEYLPDVIDIAAGSTVTLLCGTRVKIVEILSSQHTTLKVIVASHVKDPSTVYILFPPYNHDLLMQRGDHRTVYSVHVDKHLADVTLPQTRETMSIAQGILEVSNMFKQHILAVVRRMRKENSVRRIEVCGFSLGASMARLMAFELRVLDDFKGVHTVLYSLGELQTGDERWKNWWKTHRTDPLLEDHSLVLAHKGNIDTMCIMHDTMSVVPSTVLDVDGGSTQPKQELLPLEDSSIFDNQHFILQELEKRAFTFVSLYRPMFERVKSTRTTRTPGQFRSDLCITKDKTHALQIYREALRRSIAMEDSTTTVSDE